MEPKKILLVATRQFWPPFDGHEVELYNYCRGLHEKYGYDIDVFAFAEEISDGSENAAHPAFLSRVYYASKVKAATKLGNVIGKSLLSSKRWPLQASLYYSKHNVMRISALMEDNRYEAVIVDMVRLATYYDAIRHYPCKKILHIEDMLHKRYKRQLEVLTPQSNIAGAYHEKLPGPIQSMLNSVWIKKMVLKLEIPRMEKAEQFYSEQYDRVTFVSALETTEFNEKYHTNKAITLSMGVDYSYYSQMITVNKVPGMVTFVGDFRTAANADSVRMIAHDVLPHCRLVKKMVCVGICPRELADEFKENKIIHFTGKVVDLRKHVKEGMVFLAPIAFGTGIKTKIVEAMAMGMPVVTNSIGAEGLDVHNGQELIIADTPKEIANAVTYLLNDPVLREEIGRNGQRYVREHHDWNTIFETFGKMGL